MNKIQKRIEYWANKLEKAEVNNDVKTRNKAIAMVQFLEAILEANME